MNYFPESELRCPCCGLYNFDPDLLFILNVIRGKLEKPLIADSGCHCPKHNAEIGGEKDSDHLVGGAADVRAISSPTRFVIIDTGLRYGIVRIGVAEKFLHIGKNPENPQRVFWIYPPGTVRKEA